MEYTWDDIIINPTSDKAKDAVGKVVYYNNNPGVCLESANDNDCFCGDLQSVEPTERLPFVVNGGHYECIIVKNVPTYEQNQAQWITDNDIKEGDCVKILRKAGKDEEGWGDAWMSDMDNYVGRVYEVTEVYPDGIELGSDYVFPYFVLEKITSPETKTAPFKDVDEFLGYYGSSFIQPKEPLDYFCRFLDGMWIRNRHTKTLYQVVSMGASGVIIGGLKHEVTWCDLHKDFEFLDGSPCGKQYSAT